MRDPHCCKEYNITYETFRIIFNKETCPDLESVVTYDPDHTVPYLCFANKGPTIHDKRLIDCINFKIVELPRPFKGYGVKATVYLKSDKGE
jgi:hypothetical protein